MVVPQFKTDYDFANVLLHFEGRMSRAAQGAVQDSLVKIGRRLMKRIRGRAGLTRWPQHNKGTQTPSLPGTPPARITGNLLDSVYVDEETYGNIGSSTNRFFVSVGADAPYAMQQEEGFYNSGWKRQIPARPFLQPSFDYIVESGEIDKILDEAFRGIEEVFKNGR